MKNNIVDIHNIGTFVSSKCFEGLSETKPRTAICYELSFYIIDGGIAHINNEHYEIRKGDIILASPGDKRHSTLHYISKYIYFDTDNEQLRDMIASLPKHMHTSELEKYSAMIDGLQRIDQSFDSFRETELSVKFANMLFDLRRDAADVSLGFSSDAYPEIRCAIGYIEEHYAEQINVEQIAECCNMSASNFHKRFLKATKTTPNEYLLEYRIKRAKSWLVTSGWSVSKIAEKCGFNSQAYFCCCFKKHEGISPGSFRKFYKNI
ncbi:MAG: AraC family transcriptional regulator [Acutalibacteraceae bacterium]